MFNQEKISRIPTNLVMIIMIPVEVIGGQYLLRKELCIQKNKWTTCAMVESCHGNPSILNDINSDSLTKNEFLRLPKMDETNQIIYNIQYTVYISSNLHHYLIQPPFN